MTLSQWLEGSGLMGFVAAVLSWGATKLSSGGKQGQAEPNGVRQRLQDEVTALKIEVARLTTDNQWLREKDR